MNNLIKIYTVFFKNFENYYHNNMCRKSKIVIFFE